MTKRPMANPMPSQAELLEWFAYADGKLFWKSPLSKRIMIGSEAGCLWKSKRQTYRIVGIHKKTYKTHRLIWVMHYGDLDNDTIIDHKDRNTLNNHIENLRIADRRINGMNSKISSRNTSTQKGVHFDKKTNKWIAQYGKRHERRFLGRFDTFELALEARRAAEETTT